MYNKDYQFGPASTRKLTQQEFMERTTAIHGPNRYVYHNDYAGMGSILRYTCTQCNNTHETKADHHIGRDPSAQNGCPHCNKTRGGYGKVTPKTFINRPELANKPATFYIVKMSHKETNETYFKYGVTTQNLPNRFMNLRFLSKCNIEIITTVNGKYIDMFKLETNFGERVDHIKPTDPYLGSNECFMNTEGEINTILNFCMDL